MSRRADDGRARRPAESTSVPSGTERPSMSSGRETVETFVLVFLIFLVVGVEAEGFVIPTGSMAPTLMGRHKEITCPECGHVYSVNGDRESNPELGSLSPDARRIVSGTCDNCRYSTRIDDEPNFQGDRIYVMKTPLSIPFLPGLGTVRPGRWDVAVFKLPEDPEVRYIKRMVGLPGETLRIMQGDVWTRPLDDQGSFRRALRPLRHQDAMQMLVFDDSHRPRSLVKDPNWKRWGVRPGPTSVWSEPKAGTFRASPSGGEGWAELRYRHMVPDPVQWSAIAEGRSLPHPPRPTLVTDFYAYNTDLSADAVTRPTNETMKVWKQPHWVGDLTLKFRLEVAEPKGSLRVELVKAGVPYRVEFDLKTGLATLSRGEQQIGEPAPTALNVPGVHNLSVSNVDDRLTLKVDSSLPLGEGFSYGVFDADQTAAVAPTAADLEPVGLAVRGATVSVSGLILLRDIYYTLLPSKTDFESAEPPEPLPADSTALFDWLGDPRQFAAFGRFPSRDFPIAKGHYLMLGDNSPWSRDGRAWLSPDQIDPERPGRGWDKSGRESWEVPEALLIGKAFCVYWPHMKPFGPTFRLGRDTPVPSRPYFEKIRWVR